jgi:hypothetical protein
MGEAMAIGRGLIYSPGIHWQPEYSGSGQVTQIVRPVSGEPSAVNYRRRCCSNLRGRRTTMMRASLKAGGYRRPTYHWCSCRQQRCWPSAGHPRQRPSLELPGSLRDRSCGRLHRRDTRPAQDRPTPRAPARGRPTRCSEIRGAPHSIAGIAPSICACESGRSRDCRPASTSVEGARLRRSRASDA